MLELKLYDMLAQYFLYVLLCSSCFACFIAWSHKSWLFVSNPEYWFCFIIALYTCNGTLTYWPDVAGCCPPLLYPEELWLPTEPTEPAGDGVGEREGVPCPSGCIGVVWAGCWKCQNKILKQLWFILNFTYKTIITAWNIKCTQWGKWLYEMLRDKW